MRRGHMTQRSRKQLGSNNKNGNHLMLWGFLVKGWMTAIEKVGASHPEQ